MISAVPVQALKKLLKRCINISLRKLEKAIGKKTTYADKLKKYANKKINGFLGVFAQDKIPKLKKEECCIFNNHVTGLPGEHWLGLYKDDKGVSWVYDSFGRKHGKIVPLVGKTLGGVVKDTDRDVEQKKKRNQLWSQVYSLVVGM